ncbi:PREDICTED: auxin-induced protein 5NG4-like [Fragaria vesca subsp. vesca]
MENEEASFCLKPVIMMVVTQISYSVMNILYKLVAVSGMNLIVFVAYRLMFSAAFLVPLALIQKSRLKLTWTVLFEAFIIGLFGGTMTQILYMQCLALTSPTFVSAMLNLLPGITFVIALCFRLEKLNFGSKSYSSIAKIVGTVMGIGGAMLSTFYRGPVFTVWSTHIDLQNSSSVPLSPHRSSPVLGFLAGLGSSVCFATWLIVQAKMSKIYPCPYSSTALMSCMGSIQSVILAICLERDWNQWKLGNCGFGTGSGYDVLVCTKARTVVCGSFLSAYAFDGGNCWFLVLGGKVHPRTAMYQEEF